MTNRDGPTFYVRINYGDRYTYRCVQTVEDEMLAHMREVLRLEEERRAEQRALAARLEERMA